MNQLNLVTILFVMNKLFKDSHARNIRLLNKDWIHNDKIGCYLAIAESAGNYFYNNFGGVKNFQYNF